jgi:hypothetical protein
MTEYRFLNKLVETVSLEQERMCEAYVNHNGLYLAHLSPAIKGMIQTYLDRCAVDSNTAVRRRLQIHLNAISVNVQTMFGLVMLRVNPSDMKVSFTKYTRSTLNLNYALLICNCRYSPLSIFCVIPCVHILRPRLS